MTTKTTYKEPGSGAVEYAKTFTEGMSRSEAAVVITQLLGGELHDVDDNRVKSCDYCGYFWRDNSLRNTKKTCSDECKRNLKTMQRREQRANKELLNPTPKEKKHTLMDDYIWWLEYPFWINEYSMIKIGWKHERPSGVALMDYIEAKNTIYGEGNRKISKKTVEYHGDKRDQL
ncbi:hypothetical protein [Fictibacillus terranigra]|uniref:Uncharacterized protein n=1 Tax=Fictibacillus terranigra TaxID=3058424 RepID=A0ABT8E6U4_9BACL|nr:hypothetical protein [Fictibacillus sp. CENA-BCM004]MDN4073631.1 hypothetical protein [Fictibacillus sp. CENA-BCM004]